MEGHKSLPSKKTGKTPQVFHPPSDLREGLCPEKYHQTKLIAK